MYARKLGKFGTPKPQARATRDASNALARRQRTSAYIRRLELRAPSVEHGRTFSRFLERWRKRGITWT